MEEEHLNSDRRKFKRVEADIVVVYKVDQPAQVRMMIGHNEISANMINLSENGMALSTAHIIPGSTLLSIRFILINDKAATEEERLKLIKTEAEVRYSIPSAQGKFRVGIRFTWIAENDRNVIHDFVKLLSAGHSPGQP